MKLSVEATFADGKKQLLPKLDPEEALTYLQHYVADIVSRGGEHVRSVTFAVKADITAADLHNMVHGGDDEHDSQDSP